MLRLAGFCAAAVLVAGSFFSAWSQSTDAAVFKNLPDAKLAPMAGLPTCFKAEVEHGDPSKEPAVFLIQGAAKCFVPWHWHSVNEFVMMVSGTLRLQMKAGQPVLLRSGGYSQLPGKHVHRGGCVTACTFFVFSDGPFDLHYVDETGREIPAEEALKVAKKLPTKQK